MILVREYKHAIPEFATPLTCDIVGYDNVHELGVVAMQGIEKDVVHINIPEVWLA